MPSCGRLVLNTPLRARTAEETATARSMASPRADDRRHAQAEVQHHTTNSARGQPRPGEETDETNYAMGQMTPPPPAASTMYFRTDDDGDVLAAGVRPPTLAVPRPQERVLRHTVEQVGDVAPLLPALAVPVPQMVDQLVAVLTHVDSFIPGQVEVPTIVSLINVIEQTVDIPVGAGGIVGNGDHQGCLPGQSSSPSAEQTVDVPVLRHGFSGGLQGFHPGQGSSHRTVEQNDSGPRGSLHGLRPD